MTSMLHPTLAHLSMGESRWLLPHRVTDTHSFGRGAMPSYRAAQRQQLHYCCVPGPCEEVGPLCEGTNSSASCYDNGAQGVGMCRADAVDGALAREWQQHPQRDSSGDILERGLEKSCEDFRRAQLQQREQRELLCSIQ